MYPSSETPLRQEKWVFDPSKQQAPAQKPAPSARPAPPQPTRPAQSVPPPPPQQRIAQPIPPGQASPGAIQQKLPPDSPLRPGPPPEDQWGQLPPPQLGDPSSVTQQQYALPPPQTPRPEPTAPDTPLKLSGSGIPGLAPYDEETGIPIIVGQEEEPVKKKKSGAAKVVIALLIVFILLLLGGGAAAAVIFYGDQLRSLTGGQDLLARFTGGEEAQVEDEVQVAAESAEGEEAQEAGEPDQEAESTEEEPEAGEEAEEPPPEEASEETEEAVEEPEAKPAPKPRPTSTSPKPKPKPKPLTTTDPPKPKETTPAISTENLPEKPSQHMVKAAMKGVEPKVRACGKGETGLATVSVKVDGPKGKVTFAKVVGGTFKGTPQAACIEKAVKQAKMIRFKQKTLSFSYPFVIK